jgi:hypothetical protein
VTTLFKSPYFPAMSSLCGRLQTLLMLMQANRAAAASCALRKAKASSGAAACAVEAFEEQGSRAGSFLIAQALSRRRRSSKAGRAAAIADPHGASLGASASALRGVWRPLLLLRLPRSPREEPGAVLRVGSSSRRSTSKPAGGRGLAMQYDV